MRKHHSAISLALRLLSLFLIFPLTLHAQAQHGVAMHGTPKYPEGFSHFEYANPDAPKGGTLKLGVIGDNFDSFNPFIVKGTSAAKLSYVYETLAISAEDEAFTKYGLIAEKIEMPKDRSWVTFYLNPKARFSDGKAITAEDIKFSFDTLTTHERATPFYAAYYGDVSKVSIIDSHTIKFEFSTDQNKELPLILGQMPVLAKHYWEEKGFGDASLDVPVGSGPYKIESFEPGRSITYVRDKNYWAKDLGVNRGRYNFDKIVVEYYKDNTIALEAFKAGEYDFRVERTARNWANSYEGKKFDSGELIKKEIEHNRPSGMQAFVMNTRRDVFKDRRVRQALAYAFDFEWTNQNLFNGQYQRTSSFFENSELASSGLPSKAELQILSPFKNQLPAELFNREYKVPTTEEPNSIRKNLREGMKILKNAGWSIQDNVLTNSQTGKQLSFEILIAQKDFERIILPYIKNLEKMGVKASIRFVDTAQYFNRLRDFEFDMVVTTFSQSNSPGNEQRDYWHSGKKEIKGSRNLPGIDDPVVDALIDQVISAPDRVSLVNRTRALDRVLLWGHYVIPNWYNPVDRIAYSNKLERPENTPDSGVSIDSWWMKADAQAKP